MTDHPRSLTAAVAIAVLASLSLTIPSAWPASKITAPHRAVHARQATARAATMHVDVTVRKHEIESSKSGFRPGNTVFHLRSSGGVTAAVQLLCLHGGYTFAEFRHDVQSDDIEALRRIDRKAEFYGGMPVHKRGVSHFGARLDAGRYLLIDFDNPRFGRLRVDGAPERRSLPRTSGSIDMVLDHHDHRFQTPRQLRGSGWLRQTNRTDEPHFMDMIKVKTSTTGRQVRRLFTGRGPEDPAWLLRNYPGTFVISPGRTVVWRYDFPRGRYLEACFWPSSEDGTSHAEMGMWNFVTLR
jgi:hypothetical protein